MLARYINYFILLLFLLSIGLSIYLTRNVIVAKQALKETELERKLLTLNVFSFNNISNTVNLKDLRLQDVEKKTVELNTLVRSRVLILRASDKYCDECVIAELKLMTKQLGTKKTLVLCSYKHDKDFLFFAKNSGFAQICYNIIDKKISLTYENYNSPYYLLLDSDCNTISTFFPEKKLPALSKKYYESLNLF